MNQPRPFWITATVVSVVFGCAVLIVTLALGVDLASAIAACVFGAVVIEALGLVLWGEVKTFWPRRDSRSGPT